MNIPFIKMHGLGNDFIIFDNINNTIISEVDFLKRIGDRRLGDLPICYAENKLAKQELGWQPIFTHHDMCKHAYEWMKHKFIKK